MRALGVKDLVCLGDVVGYGPDPEFCVDLVRGHARWCLMGNHDEALFRDASDFNPHARGAIEYTRRRMQPHWYSSSEKKSVSLAGESGPIRSVTRRSALSCQTAVTWSTPGGSQSGSPNRLSIRAWVSSAVASSVRAGVTGGRR